MALSDPFPVAKEEVQSALGEARALHQRWLQLVHGGDLEELDWTTNELLTNLQNLDWDLQDMMKAIEAVERDKGYKIDSAEIASRRKFVNDTKSQVSRIRNEVQDPKWKHRQDQKDSRESLLASSGPGSSKESNARAQAERRNQSFIDDHSQQQAQIMRDQDESLDGLGHTVKRIGNMAIVIGDEISDQNRMLGELEDNMDRTQGRLEQVTSKVNQLMKDKDRGKYCAIFVLSIVFILLLVAVIYT